jgi:D-alanyl-D-alanine carboxypeptidase
MPSRLEPTPRSRSNRRFRLRQLWVQLGIPADYAEARYLPLQREAKTLVSIGRNPDGRLVKLDPRTANAWLRMKAAAANDGIELQPISGFRSVARQTRIVREKLAAGNSIRDILRIMAAPGCSEHHSGRALDIGSSDAPDLNGRFAQTTACRWLEKNAGRFGFQLSYSRRNPHGIGYEPWHWCRVG